ncbi:MAG: cbb3-type cytochrome c oxidase subunit 3 [Sphingomonadales bacterium]|nr:cbb3-type cytochrome c oxidase subunit 3 [Sphingomonadales bacterium]
MTGELTYVAVRDFTATWGLVLTVATFVILVAWPFRPGAGKVNDAAARMIFEDENDV